LRWAGHVAQVNKNELLKIMFAQIPEVIEGMAD
jgi:hypothetical protein